MNLYNIATQIFQSALDEVDAEKLIEKSVFLKDNKFFIKEQEFDLSLFKNIYVIGIGKVSSYMAKALSEILKDKITYGIVVYLPEHEVKLKNITFLPGSHPVPDEKSLKAGEEVLKLARQLGEEDLAIILISGGGSALMVKPLEGIFLEDKKKITKLLLASGANISEINTVRKHLSKIKGGNLARAIFPGSIINLAISDVIGNSLEDIISGPTYWDSTTFYDAYSVLKKYKIWDKVPLSVQKVILKGIKGEIPETPKKNFKIFEKTSSFIIGNNRTALESAMKKAQELGFNTEILTDSDSGEARERATYYASIFKKLIQSEKPKCLLSGGELTVTVIGKGKGGRNQEFVLACLIEMSKISTNKNWLIASIGTDGTDGPTDAAGAWITPEILEKTKKLKLNPVEYLNNNDSYSFFSQVDGLIKTGPTKTNVMDIRIFLVQ
ncbi:glycerate kinase [Candidatus Aminicenantes bacterium AC-335-A11]|jgi:glycerate-2-kinase|nr:glycerate kinase [SCandidatus Aminicenantes bacterium Aminicenantia_JdfR_composite]MCP2596635.1 glycerate kinase [Candidatus Aminicenantes bacterium AC-335-G13]MCP2598039.1 glycerate kinase [Candidatus Aminicenantes bacterium AC-335-L06]MCP2618377.1 glycerate kinase [Candidatus Aminicenantes bacterium AC-335-A11]